jgi:hypothetical protein
MSDEPKKRARRGRPAKNPEKKMRKRSDSLSSAQDQEFKKETSKFHNRMIENYYELHANFMRDGISQQCQHLVRKIVQGHEVPEVAKVQPLMVYFNCAMQEFMMNELEIVVLGIYLEKFGWSNLAPGVELVVRYTAYAAKDYLAEDMNPLNAFLSYKHPGFIENYEQWKPAIRSSLPVNPKDLNDKFKELSKAVKIPEEAKIMDYNYYVDEILQSSPNLAYEKSKALSSVPDPELLELIRAIKEKRRIVDMQNQEIPKELLEKVETCFGWQGKAEDSSKHDENTYVINPSILKKIENFQSDIEGHDEEDS